MLQQRPVQADVSEVLDGLDFMNSLASVPELDPPLKVITKGLVLSLHAECQVPRQTWTLICAGEVAHECIVEIIPTIDVVRGQAVQPRPSSSLKHERCIPNCHPLAASRDADCS